MFQLWNRRQHAGRLAESDGGTRKDSLLKVSLPQKLLTKNKNWGEDAGDMRDKGTERTSKWQVFAKFSYRARQ